MANPNLGWLFYRDYYTAIRDWSDLKASQQAISEKVDRLIETQPEIETKESFGNTHFKATTIYPGLLLGSGNAHELPSLEGQAILGFHFDYTTGLPTIQGSSIKGLLRSAFGHWEYIAEIGGETLVSQEDVESLESEIFENGDIFFDANIISYSSSLLGDDYITPHGDDPLKNPIPLRFIKVMPDVTFGFDFELTSGILTKDEKRKLFQDIIKDLGLGAKTNVGYGKFENFGKWQTEEEREEEKRELANKLAREETKRVEEIEEKKREKEKKAEEGIKSLLQCKTLADGFKLLKDSFGRVPSPTPEEIKVIQKFYDKQKKISKSDKKVFKKYGIDV